MKTHFKDIFQKYFLIWLILKHIWKPSPKTMSSNQPIKRTKLVAQFRKKPYILKVIFDLKYLHFEIYRDCQKLFYTAIFFYHKNLTFSANRCAKNWDICATIFTKCDILIPQKITVFVLFCTYCVHYYKMNTM